ncbi:MAG: hypothetical protein GY750_01425 [Lentisphaerae bacterium]|nr:hypothetical protein [Lentisphaerota bacterium]
MTARKDFKNGMPEGVQVTLKGQLDFECLLMMWLLGSVRWGSSTFLSCLILHIAL